MFIIRLKLRYYSSNYLNPQMSFETEHKKTVCVYDYKISISVVIDQRGSIAPTIIAEFVRLPTN